MYAVIYHDADFDGKLSNLVCRHFLEKEPGATVHSYGWDYGRPTPLSGLLSPVNEASLADWANYDRIYIVDLSVDALMAREDLHEKIVWIDHHQSAIQKYQEGMFAGLQYDGVAACRLCWQWFTLRHDQNHFPSIDEFKDRQVTEPILIRLAGEYDVCDKRDPDAEPLQYSMRSLDDHGLIEFFANAASNILDERTKNIIMGIAVTNGKKIQQYVEKQQDEYALACATTVKWHGLSFVSLNIGQRGNSSMIRAAIEPEHDACFVWRWDGRQVYCSLYHIPGREGVDILSIAKAHGGGGHPGACGFRISLEELSEILGSFKATAVTA